MSERRWTDRQRQAIDNRDRTLLVSAAAGSGKTATLTERVIRSLMDENAPVSVDSLLVVTFTNAAATELRAKISRALEEAVAANPGDKRLMRQLFMLPEAKIRTIDSFCGDILRSNADRVGVPFNYRIADVSECELLSESVMDGLIEAVYSGLLPDVAAPSEFEELADCLTDSKRAEELSSALRYIYEKCESEEEGVEAFARLADIYDPEKFTSVRESLHGSFLYAEVAEMCRHYTDAVSPYKARFSGAGGEYLRFYDLAVSDLSAISSLLTDDYNELRERVFSLKLSAKPRVKEQTEDTESYALIRDMFREDLKKLRPLFLYTEEQWHALYASLYRLTSILSRFLVKFSELYDREKLRRAILSYADVERYAYRCLIEDGRPTEVAENIRNSYSAVYIDEYQDVNSLQNSIFRAISRPDNCFMVGDIKQSIYGFRSACPDIFASMKRAFTPIDKAEAGERASIFMSDNFRCDRAVVDFVNAVFDRAFSLSGESIGYLPEDALVYSKIHETEPEYHTPEICMIDRGVSEDEDETSGNAPDVVAAKIDALITRGRLDDGSPIAPSDIAILLRNSKGKDHLYADALERRGIPVRISGAKSFFLSSEVLLALCLLNSIDNPGRDIYLAGLMRSPLFSFTADELYLIRHRNKDGTLYDSLISYTESHPEFKKGSSFIERLSYYRMLSESITLPELLFKLYHETGLLALAANSGGRENLMLLYDYACSFSAGESGGLYSFIHFINSLLDRRTTFDDTRESSEGSAVRIVTCHASKGLEYPVVFLVDAGARIRNKDTARRIVYSRNMGIAMRLRTSSGLAVVNNPVIDIINRHDTIKNFEEELRVLYVALTRARERLYIVGTALSSNTEEYIDRIRHLSETLTPYSFKKLASYLEIILASSGRTPMSAREFIGGFADVVEEEPVYTQDSESSDGYSTSEGLSDELYNRFTFEYKNIALTRLPEKMSVSKATPTVLDGSDEGIYELKRHTEESGRIAVPRFISGSAADESARRGIATHYFMQFCDLDRFYRLGAEDELLRLVEAGYISPSDGERVRVSELEMFRRSELFKHMRSAVRLYREQRFNVRLPAHMFTEDEAKEEAYEGRGVLVQGVIDCVMEYPDGTIGLYDYKTDRLSPAELADRTLAEKTLTDRHRTQLAYYAEAAERIFGKRPTRVGVYSLHLGDTVIIPDI